MNEQQEQDKAAGGESELTVGLERCWPWSHKYSKWEDRCTVTKSRVRDDTVVNEGVLQERRCVKCGRLQMRTEWSDAL